MCVNWGITPPCHVALNPVIFLPTFQVLHAHLPKGISACAADIVLAILPTALRSRLMIQVAPKPEESGHVPE